MFVAQTLYFYDLETTGTDTRNDRVMQFAGQRTDMQLNNVGQPDNFLIKLSDDIVPNPTAVMITGITPQKSINEGITESEFLKIFTSEISVPGTIFVGFNSVRFDDELMRFMLYRNFYDAYEWHWQEGRSRWDMLDVVRMMRALRPEGINWPFDKDSKPTNRLELLTGLNAIEHGNAHDALSDVFALIDLARLIRKKQPKLFDFMLNIRDKKDVSKLVNSGQPFVYTSGKYSNDWQKTTVVAVVADYANRGSLVFDLRNDPTEFASMSPIEMAKAWTRRHNEEGIKLPIKKLLFNHCPAIAPLAVMDLGSQKRLGIKLETVLENFKKLQETDFRTPLLEALDIVEKSKLAKKEPNEDVDTKLYDGFLDNNDKNISQIIRQSKPEELNGFLTKIKDQRLQGLLPLYKARNFHSSLDSQELKEWEEYRRRRLMGGKQSSRLAIFFKNLALIANEPNLTPEKQYLLEELQLYGQSIMPNDTDD